jgi:hypothetical protein
LQARFNRLENIAQAEIRSGLLIVFVKKQPKLLRAAASVCYFAPIPVRNRQFERSPICAGLVAWVGAPSSSRLGS